MEMTMDCRKVRENIVSLGTDYVQKAKLKSLVLGVSGGIDSALTAALANEICENLGIPLYGLYMAIESNKQEERDSAFCVGTYCTNFKEYDLSPEFETFYKSFEEDDLISEEPTKISRGNAKARLRMIKLYDIAGRTGGCVLSTDNLTELLLGFWTLHGDVGDLGLIQSLWKTEVYQLAEYLEVPDRALSITPTDGLGVSESDLDQLGAKSYTEVDALLQKYTMSSIKHSSPLHTVEQRYEATHFKRNNPYNLSREDIFINKR